MKIIFLFLLSSFTFLAQARPVYEFMDLQTHVTMNHAYSVFGDGTTIATPEQISKLTYKHQLKSVIFQNLLAKNPGARIIINGAIAFEYATDKSKIRKVILEQMSAINEMAAKNSTQFVVAKTPAEVRKLVHETDKTIIIHSIEGGNELIESQEDADFWAQQGVAFITLIHLLDDEYGGAGHNPDLVGTLLNFRGTLRKLHKNKYRGLTLRGKNAIRWLAKAGIMTDLSHMSPQSVTDSIEVLKELNLPPLITHSLYQPIHNNDRAVTHQQLLEVYKLGGLYSLPISGFSVLPDKPSDEFKRFAEGQKICEKSLDNYRLSFQFTEASLLKARHGNKRWNELSEEQKIDSSIGWQSDFNGWLNHSRPRYGKDGCYPLPANTKLSEIETRGLAHPGLLSEYWSTLELEGMNISSLKYSTEKFLRMWEKFSKK